MKEIKAQGSQTHDRSEEERRKCVAVRGIGESKEYFVHGNQSRSIRIVNGVMFIPLSGEGINP